MAKTERELVESARDRLRRAEAMIELAIRDVAGVVRLNQAAGKAGLTNAASAAQGELQEGLGGMRKAHARATDILLTNWPDFGGEVVIAGPGR